METRAPQLGEPLPVELMNTVWADRDGVHDALASPAEAVAWLRAIAPRAALTGADLRDVTEGDGGLAVRLRELRDALRWLAADVTADPRTAARSAGPGLSTAVAVVNRAAAVAPGWSALEWRPGQAPTRVIRTAGPAADGLISAIAGRAAELFGGEHAAKLRACLAPGCVLYFVKEHPRREWCSAGCGNRARVARHYRRHRAGGTGGPG